MRSQVKCSEVSTAWNIPLATYHVVVTGGSHFRQSPKGGGSGDFLLKCKGGPTLFMEKTTWKLIGMLINRKKITGDY